MKTRVTEILNIEHPIMQGGMQHLGVPDLAAAVSKAGGLGTINVTVFPDPADLRKAIRQVKARTSKPFAVNISLIPSLHPGKELFDQVDVILDEQVPVVETAGASPKELADILVANKKQVKWVHKAACVKHAKKAESLGADVLTIAGYEVAGHPFKDEIGTMVLANITARELGIPVMAAGGIADGRGLAAALALGCEGVVMGTRFVAAEECWIHQNFKEWMIQAHEMDTTICQRSINNMARVANNKAAQKCKEMEAQGATLQELMTVISGKKGKEAYISGAIDDGMFAIGPAIGLIHEVKPAKAIIDDIMAEAEETIARLNQLNK